MTTKYLSEGEIEHLAWQYEQLSDEDVLLEWERGEPMTIDVGEPMVSRSPSRCTLGPDGEADFLEFFEFGVSSFGHGTAQRAEEVHRAAGVGGGAEEQRVDADRALGDLGDLAARQ